ncbi:MAG: NAD(P)-dependent alcohol dehydrogenase [Lachnospiraceae bacterium]|nr:NAD(P)-dependent alcohol dehydrogenase [Lachnospiraceae bacterium]
MEMQRGAFMRGLDNMIIKEIEKPTAGPGKVVVSIEYVGICGSDVHYYHSGRVGAYEVDLSQDYMLGHECGGVVVEVGEGVEDLKVGDKVALEPGQTCGQCEACKEGHYNLCPDVVFLATPPVQGCNMEYIEYPQEYCFKLPEKLTTLEGAMIEPLSVGMHAANQAAVGVGDSVVILGSGAIGLTTLLSCRAHGCGTVIVSDLVDSRLQKAKELGADYVINGGSADVLEEVKKITGGRMADQVFETAGSPVTIQQTPFLAKRGGTVTLVGISTKPEIAFNFAQVMDKELTIKSVFRYRNIYPRAIAAVASGAIDVKGIVTHEFDFDHIQEAYQEAVNNKTDLVKAVIKVK